MRDGNIDYSKYTLLELEEALAGIKRHKYPKNYLSLCSAYQNLGGSPPVQDQMRPATKTEEAVDVWKGPKYDENGQYVPNQIPSGERIWHVVLSLMLFAYGTYGICINDIYIPGRRSRGTHLQDVPAWLMYGAMISACLVMLSLVVDHYDRRDNERYYRGLANLAEVVGWTLFGVSLVWAMV